MEEAARIAVAALGIGAALASAPGPVQAVIVSEAARGGMTRGFAAMAGASGTFALLLVMVTFGVSVAPLDGDALGLLRVCGGVVLLWLAREGLHSGLATERSGGGTHRAPLWRGALSVAVNPGALLFLATVAAPLLSAAGAAGGTGGSLMVVAALVCSAAAGDSLIVVASGVGLRRMSERARMSTARVLSALLAGLGLWMVIGGVRALG